MRIVVDLQGAQGQSKHRGIGRYALSLVKALVRTRGKHEVILVLNGLFRDTIEPLRGIFEGLLPQSNILVWQAVGPLAHIVPSNELRRETAELTYEAFLAEQDPDFIYITSLFEGLSDDAVTSIHRLQNRIPVAVTLYDLIPYIYQDIYLENPEIKSWYLEKIEHLRRADLFLAISESARREGFEYLKIPENRAVNISTDADEHFQKTSISLEREQSLRQRYGLARPFVLYTVGIDHRKNIEGLIRAYARLPSLLRSGHQLAIVCSIQEDSRRALHRVALGQGLADRDVVFTNFVPEDDLRDLYNLCKLFVFPSWHEGFGLPALEAMRCGAPVIGSNTSSLPEVIGWGQALFDPRSDEDIASLMLRALTDEEFRQALIRSGGEQSKRFSWEQSARQAVAAMEQWLAAKRPAPAAVASPQRPRLAYVSPLPPAHSGIADYSAELLPQLARYYDIDVIVDQNEALADPWVMTHCGVRSASWLFENAIQYERVLYHFGNSHYHRSMFDLLERVPGVVVLHDFFLSGAQASRDAKGEAPIAWALELLRSHGYSAVREKFSESNLAGVIWRYPTNLSVLQRASAVIVHSRSSQALAEKWYGPAAAGRWALIPHLRVIPKALDRQAARIELGLGDEDILVCSFGVLGATKLNHRLLRAWIDSPLAKNPRVHLVFVGENDGGEYGQSLRKAISTHRLGDRVKITGWASPETFRSHLAAADIGVQLRALSRGETSGTVLDCMNHGLATVVNAHGSMADLDPSGVWLLPDEFADADLSSALLTLAAEPERRLALGRRAREIVRTRHDPEVCGQRYFEVIEAAYKEAQERLPGLLRGLAIRPPDEAARLHWSVCLAANFPPKPRPRKLFVDVSELVSTRTVSALQRGIRALLRGCLEADCEGFQVEPVYATDGANGYRYAREFTCQLIGVPTGWVADDPVEAWSGDVFIALDANQSMVVAQRACLTRWRDAGVQLWSVVYDLFPRQGPDYLDAQAVARKQAWLDTVSQFDGLLCTSEALANECSAWQASLESTDRRPLRVKWFRVGLDRGVRGQKLGMSKNDRQVLIQISRRPTFVVVGAFDSRKAFDQVFGAFGILWQSGVDINVVFFCGDRGSAALTDDELKTHPENSRRLFVVGDVTDEYREKIYAASVCLIDASYGADAGFAICEAAQYGLPVLVRDVPVFRECAGIGASYFVAERDADFAVALQNWMTLQSGGKWTVSSPMQVLTSGEGARKLLQQILNQ